VIRSTNNRRIKKDEELNDFFYSDINWLIIENEHKPIFYFK
jgi:hypothetical protein